VIELLGKGLLRIIIFSLFIFGLSGSSLSAQTKPDSLLRGGTLRGTVYQTRYFKSLIPYFDSLTQTATTRLATIRKVIPIENATVLLKGTARLVKTNGEGKYLLKSVARGRYDVVYVAEGFKPYTFTTIGIKRDTITEIDMELYEAISVSADESVRANRYETALKESPLTTTLLRQDFLTHRNSRTIDDGLAFVPGFINSRIRGGAAQNFYIDQIPIPNNFTLLPTDFLKQVEIIKGANSTLYGSGSESGTIHLTTSTDFSPHTELGYFGSRLTEPNLEQSPTLKNGFRLSQAAQSERWGVYGSLTSWNDDARSILENSRQWRLFSKLNYRLADDESLSLLALGSLTDAGKNDPDSYTIFLAPTYTNQISQRSTRFLRSRYSRESHRQESAQELGTEMQQVWNWSKGFFLTVGAAGSYSDLTAQSVSTRRAANGALYLSTDIPFLKQLTISFGVRAEGQSVFGDSIGDSPKFQFSPRFGAMFFFNPYSTLRASFTNGYRFPSFAERFSSRSILFANAQGFGDERRNTPFQTNPNLKPERASSVELGYLFNDSHEQRLFGEITITERLFDASIFANNFNDGIATTSIGNLDTTRAFVTTDNQLSFRNLGMELSGKLGFNRQRFILNGGYLWLSSRLEGDSVVTQTDQHLFYFNPQLRLGRFSVDYYSRVLYEKNFSSQWVAQVQSDVGLRATVGHFTVNVMARNLTNRLPFRGELSVPRQVMIQVRTIF
jgi:outer membrane receptor protein involved in Fe transport